MDVFKNRKFSRLEYGKVKNISFDNLLSGAVLNDADVKSAVKGGSKTFCAGELVVRNTKFLNPDGNIDRDNNR